MRKRLIDGVLEQTVENGLNFSREGDVYLPKHHVSSFHDIHSAVIEKECYGGLVRTQSVLP